MLLKVLCISVLCVSSQTCKCHFAPRTSVWIPDSAEPRMGFSPPSKNLLLLRRPLEASALLCSPTRRSQVLLDSASAPPQSPGLALTTILSSFQIIASRMQARKMISTRKRRAGPPETATAGWSISKSQRTSSQLVIYTTCVFSSVEAQKDPGRARVPVVCLERLKILVSQLPPHGRRQSDPLPASGTEAPPPQCTWQASLNEVGLVLLLTSSPFC